MNLKTYNVKLKTFFLLFSIVTLLFFGIFTFMVKLDKLTQLDFNLIVKIQDNVPDRFDKYLALFDKTGSFWIIAPVVLTVYIWRKKLYGLIPFFFFGSGHVIEYFLKKALHQPGPPFQFHRYYDFVSFDKDHVIEGFSYPSGHSMRAVFIFMTFAWLIAQSKLSRNIKLSLGSCVLFLSVMIITAKAVFGEHWPSDLLGGMLLGAGLAGLSIYLSVYLNGRVAKS